MVSDGLLGSAYPFSDLHFATSFEDRFLAVGRSGQWLQLRMAQYPLFTTGQMDSTYCSAVGYDPVARVPVAGVKTGPSQWDIVQVFGGERQSFTFTTGMDDGKAPGLLKHYTQVTIQSDGPVTVTPIIDGLELAAIECPDGRVCELLGVPADGDLRGYTIQFRITGEGVLRLIRYQAEVGEDR